MLELFSDSKVHVFAPGVRKKTWHKNCLALGDAAVTFDHFSHSPLYVAAVTLMRFIEFWPSSEKVCQHSRGYLNQKMIGNPIENGIKNVWTYN